MKPSVPCRHMIMGVYLFGFANDLKPVMSLAKLGTLENNSNQIMFSEVDLIKNSQRSTFIP